MRLKRRSRTTTYAATPDYTSSLGRLFKLDTRLTGQDSGFLTIHNNDEALAWRAGLIENATKSIDAQYYSWHADISGRLLIRKLIKAADRGVRVRLLLDDIHTFGADRRIATLNSHPNIEVRLFNPFRLRFSVRIIWLLEFLWNIDRLNHRMHNKLLIADNVISIIGGRNIGDEYFGLNTRFVFRDLDMLACGPAVSDFSRSFDLYWNSSKSKKARRIIAFRPRQLDYRQMKKRLEKHLMVNNQIIQRVENLKYSLFSNPELGDSLTISRAHVFYDPPEQGGPQLKQLINALYDCGNNTKSQLTIVSAYFVPSKILLASLRSLAEKGIRIQVYTNSLASIDVTAVFSGYQHARIDLLSMGVELYEFRSDPVFHSVYSTPSVNVDSFGLHAKTIIYDSSSVYVGSLNFDRRSSKLNTEIGMLIDSPTLADNIRLAFQKDLSEGEFWKVTLDNDGHLLWSCGKESTRIQPARGPLQRLSNYIFSRLPIQQHL